MDDILALARQTVHRSPLDGDDESYLNTTRRPSQSSHHAALPSSQGHATDVGDLRSVEGGPQWSAESAHLSGAVPMSTSFGGRSDMAQVARIVEQKSVACDEIDHSEDQHPQDPEPDQIWWGINDPNTLHDSQGKSLGSEEPVTAVASPSAVSLTMVGGSSSSSGHEAVLSTGQNSRRTSGKRNSLPGPRPMPSLEIKSRRHSSTPPSAFPSSPDSNFDRERQADAPDQSDKMSIKSFLSRLRTGRRKSVQSMSTIHATLPQTRGLEELPLFSASTSNTISPSLLNPPIVLPPSPAILTFPRGVTGNSYASSSPQQDQGIVRPPSLLWHPVVLPSPPSPVSTENSVMGEGLLHPRLSRYGHSQTSTPSLRDHEDYTRPINAVCQQF